MVGDKLTTDIQGANGVGMQSVWINRHGAQRPEGSAEPSFEIADLKELPQLLRKLNA